MIVKSDFVKVFHFVAALQFFFGIYYECFHVLPEELKLRKFSFGGKFIYLTFLDAVSFLLGVTTRPRTTFVRVNFCVCPSKSFLVPIF